MDYFLDALTTRQQDVTKATADASLKKKARTSALSTTSSLKESCKWEPVQSEVFEAASSLLKDQQSDFGHMLNCLYGIRILPYVRAIKQLEDPRKKINEYGDAMRALNIHLPHMKKVRIFHHYLKRILI